MITRLKFGHITKGLKVGGIITVSTVRLVKCLAHSFTHNDSYDVESIESDIKAPLLYTSSFLSFFLSFFSHFVFYLHIELSSFSYPCN